MQRERGRVVAAPSLAPRVVAAAKPAPAKAKLGYREQRELDALPDLIAQLETEQASLLETLASPVLYADEPTRARELQARHEAIETELMAALERWELLGSR